MYSSSSFDWTLDGGSSPSFSSSPSFLIGAYRKHAFRYVHAIDCTELHNAYEYGALRPAPGRGPVIAEVARDKIKIRPKWVGKRKEKQLTAITLTNQ